MNQVVLQNLRVHQVVKAQVRVPKNLPALMKARVHQDLLNQVALLDPAQVALLDPAQAAHLKVLQAQVNLVQVALQNLQAPALLKVQVQVVQNPQVPLAQNRAQAPVQSLPAHQDPVQVRQQHRSLCRM